MSQKRLKEVLVGTGVKQNYTDEEKKDLAQILRHQFPGQFQSAIGGIEIEQDGKMVLSNYDLVGVPVDENGLPYITEFIMGGMKSHANTVATIGKGQKVAQVGRICVPVVINGELMEMRGGLTLFQNPSGTNFGFSPNIRQSYSGPVYDKDRKPVTDNEGKTVYEEKTAWPKPIWTSSLSASQNIDDARQKDWNTLVGRAAAFRLNIGNGGKES